MKRPYNTPVVKASPDIKVTEPRISKLVIFITKCLGRLYLFFFLGVAKAALRNEKILFDTFKRALEGKSRCIVAFRHPNGGEPQILTWLFLFKLRAFAARKGVKFTRMPHAVFLYGYDVIRWGGWIAKFIMPNLGAMPINHSKIDSKGMARIIKGIADGPYPVALAPEGHVSYAADMVRHLEPGAIRIGFMAAKKLKEDNDDRPVEILPLSIHFRYGPWGKINMKLLLKKIEKVCGLSGGDRDKLAFLERLSQCRQHLLEVNESRFKIKADLSLSFEERLDKVISASLETAERMLGIEGEGDFFRRYYKLRELCWDKLILPGVENFEGMSQVEQSVLDVQAGEAWYISRYQELIHFLWHFKVPLPAEDASIHNKIEYVQNLWDFAARTMGGSYANRVSIFPRMVVIRAAPVINLSERLQSFKEDKKTAVTKALEDLEKIYLNCIAENTAEVNNPADFNG